MQKQKFTLAIIIAALMLFSQLVGILPVSAAAASYGTDASPVFKVEGPKNVVLICGISGKSAGVFPEHALPGKTKSGNFFAYNGPIEEGDDFSAKCAEQLALVNALAEELGGTLSKDPLTGVLVVVISDDQTSDSSSLTSNVSVLISGSTGLISNAAADQQTFESNSNLLEKDVVTSSVAIAQNPNLNGGLTGQDKKEAVDPIVDNGSDKTDEWCAAHPHSNNCK